MRELEPPRVTGEQRAAIVAMVKSDATVGNVAALRAAGVEGTRGELRAMIDGDLADELREARGYGNTTIRNEMARRAIEGVDEPVFHQGDVVGYVRRYSDRLLAKMADAYLPEFRDVKRVEVTGPNAGPVVLEDRSASLADVARILVAAGALAGLGGGADRGQVPDGRALLPAPVDD